MQVRQQEQRLLHTAARARQVQLYTRLCITYVDGSTNRISFRFGEFYSEHSTHLAPDLDPSWRRILKDLKAQIPEYLSGLSLTNEDCDPTRLNLWLLRS